MKMTLLGLSLSSPSVHSRDFAWTALAPDLGDKQLVNAKAKDVEHECYEAEVDLADDIGARALGVLALAKK